MNFNSILAALPKPNEKRIALHINQQAEHALRQGHPWVFDQSITEQGHEGQPGDLAVIFDDRRKFLAIGLYDPTSPIRVRILQSRQAATIDTSWFTNRIRSSALLRKPLTELSAEKITTGWRLIHGENDGLPGLVIDHYAGTFVVKIYTPAWIPHLNNVIMALSEVHQFERIILRLSRSLTEQADQLHGLYDGIILAGSDLTGPVLFQENGLTFEADPIQGQKTGFFLDQRENRARVGIMSRDKTVLNVFAYTGGFSVYAARGGAKEVVSVDISTAAMEIAVRNMAHNLQYPGVAAASHETIAQDAFEVLEKLEKEKRRFDIVIIDPPMFAQNQSQTAAAIHAHQRLTKLGLGVLKPGGNLMQASCSSRVDSDSFFAAIHQAARESGRRLTEIERTGHGIDHPIGFREGAYLKCLFARAE